MDSESFCYLLPDHSDVQPVPQSSIVLMNVYSHASKKGFYVVETRLKYGDVCFPINKKKLLCWL